MSNFDPNTDEPGRQSLEQIKQDLAEHGVIWEEQSLYLRYAAELLGRDPAEEPLPEQTIDWTTNEAIKPPWFPGYLTAGEDRCLFNEVTVEVDLSLDQWDRFSVTERLPFMKRAIDRLKDKMAREQRPMTRKRRRKGLSITRPLTLRQTEAMKLHGECEGSIAEIARRMGVTRKTAEQHVQAAFTKLGKSVPTKAKTTAIKTDRRGQADITNDDDHRG